MKCTKCLLEKPDSETSSKSKTRCKTCYNKYANNYYHNKPNHKQKVAAYDKRKRKELRMEVLSHYSNGEPICKCCGETTYEFLSIDHMNNDGAEHRRQGIMSKVFYQWLKKNNYPSEFQVLCMNCNFAKGNYGYCPHNKKTTSSEVVLSLTD